MSNEATKEEVTMMTALHVLNGHRVNVDGAMRLVHASHYSGDVDGNGTITLEFGYGRQWQGSSSTPMEVAR